MNLPKNITQIGEADCHCKIYVEDYVVSYMKQLNQLAMDKDMAVALYGDRKEEDGVSYLFLYGACRLTFLQKETRHLSQAQQQEIEKLRKRYFQEYTFLGYRLLNGEMLEGFHICEQDICRYISGYAQFYEKNDKMLAYMLDVREEAPTEVVDQEKYEVVRRRQEERRAQNIGGSRRSAREEVHGEEKINHIEKSSESGRMRGMRAASVAAFLLLCLAGLSALDENGSLEDLQVAAKQVMSRAMEQRLPDATDGTEEQENIDTLVAEEKLTDAVLKENELAMTSPAEGNTVAEGNNFADVASESIGTESVTSSGESIEASTESSSEAVAEEPAVSQPVSYTIKSGDTLIGICIRTYGTDEKVDEICTLNRIDDPDDIKEGQKILLP